jgi:hypothetical protein
MTISENLRKLLSEMADEDLPTTDLGYEEEIPESEDLEKKKEDEESVSEEFSDSEYDELLPTDDLGYAEEVPDEELEALVGDEEIRPEGDQFDIGDQSSELPDNWMPESEDIENELEEEDEEDLEKMVDEAILSFRRNKKLATIKEEEEIDSEKEEEDKKEVAEESSCDDSSNLEEEDESTEEDEEDKEMTESLNKLFKGQKLTENFKKKTQTIFEAAITEKINKERKVLREAYKVATKRKVKQFENKLISKVSDYLDYAITEWIKENKVAITESLEHQISEEFMSNLKKLFERHYISVPKSKKNLVSHLEKKVKSLEDRLNEQTLKNISLAKGTKKLYKALVIKEASVGLTESQKARLEALTENVNFTNKKELVEAVQTIKETFLVQTKTSNAKTNKNMTSSGISLNENTNANEDSDVNGYLDALRKRNL